MQSAPLPSTTKTSHYSAISAHGHPLARKDGTVRRNRLVLFSMIGPGEHKCHWCSKTIKWTIGRVGSNSIVSDHVDSDPSNDSESNLVASCQGCNAHRSRTGPIQPGEVVYRKKSGQCMRGIIVKCAECESPFVARMTSKGIPLNRFCSRRCFSKNNWPNVDGKIHAALPWKLKDGEDFVRTGRDNEKVRVYSFECRICGVEFKASLKSKVRPPRCCSKSCAMKSAINARRDLAIARGYPEVVELYGRKLSAQKRICKFCGIEFMFQCGSRNNGVFCGHSCAAKSKSGMAYGNGRKDGRSYQTTNKSEI